MPDAGGELVPLLSIPFHWYPNGGASCIEWASMGGRQEAREVNKGVGRRSSKAPKRGPATQTAEEGCRVNAKPSKTTQKCMQTHATTPWLSVRHSDHMWGGIFVGLNPHCCPAAQDHNYPSKQAGRKYAGLWDIGNERSQIIDNAANCSS